jgi:hypothetical protein
MEQEMQLLSVLILPFLAIEHKASGHFSDGFLMPQLMWMAP